MLTTRTYRLVLPAPQLFGGEAGYDVRSVALQGITVDGTLRGAILALAIAIIGIIGLILG